MEPAGGPAKRPFCGFWFNSRTGNVIESLAKTMRFLKALAADPRIPARDKAVFTGLIAYLVNPFDLIPDFIPLAGYADDLFVVALVLDYVFNVVPESVILEHFPWRPERYAAIRKRARLFSRLVPDFIRQRIWKAARDTASQAAP